MHPRRVREHALALLAEGNSLATVSAQLGVHRSTITHWRDRPRAIPPPRDCPVCEGEPLRDDAYAALLGFYLGDGHIALSCRYDALRISCDPAYPGIIADITEQIRGVRPHSRVFLVRGTGAVNVQSQWRHWHCLFPQCGPGPKHMRPIILEPWQRAIVVREPAAFLRGLFHSDGCRSNNWTRRRVAGEWRRYDYPRWQFSNNSDDIRGLCTWALDLVAIRWRQSSWKTISVSRRADVARLDTLIGLKR